MIPANSRLCHNGCCKRMVFHHPLHICQLALGICHQAEKSCLSICVSGWYGLRNRHSHQWFVLIIRYYVELLWCSSHVRFGQWECLPAGSRDLVTCHCRVLLSCSILSSTVRCSRLLLCFPCPCAGISYFSNESWLLTGENGFRDQDLRAACAQPPGGAASGLGCFLSSVSRVETTLNLPAVCHPSFQSHCLTFPHACKQDIC